MCFPSHVQHFLLEKIFEVLCVSFPLCPDSFPAEYKFKSQINSMCFRTHDSDFLSLDIIPWYKLESYEKRRPQLKNGSIRLACGNICGVLSWSLIDIEWLPLIAQFLGKYPRPYDVASWAWMILKAMLPIISVWVPASIMDHDQEE